jgi:hypothetical protein
MSNKYMKYSKAPYSTDLIKKILADALVSAEDKVYYDVLKLYSDVDSYSELATKKANDIVQVLYELLYNDED